MAHHHRLLVPEAQEESVVEARYAQLEQIVSASTLLGYVNVSDGRPRSASDYILIPTLPSNKTTERVPLLLDRLKKLCAVINPDLQIAGVVLNRTRSTQLASWEQDLWCELQVRCLDQWELPVYAFQTFLRLSTEVRDSETEFSSPTPGSELHTLFSQLATELETRLPGVCRRTANAPLEHE